MNHSFWLWGAGGHGKVVLDALLARYPAAALRFYDSDPECHGRIVCGRPVEGLPTWDDCADERFVVSIGDNHLRAACYKEARLRLPPATVIHPAAVVSPFAEIGPGSVVLAGAVVNAGARIGANSIVNTGAIVEHDCRVGDHAHISPRAVLGGEVAVRDFAQVGIGATVLPRLSIGTGALVGAGSTVIREVPPGAVVAGVPARVLRFNGVPAAASGRGTRAYLPHGSGAAH